MSFKRTKGQRELRHRSRSWKFIIIKISVEKKIPRYNSIFYYILQVRNVVRYGPCRMAIMKTLKRHNVALWCIMNGPEAGFYTIISSTWNFYEEPYGALHVSWVSWDQKFWLESCKRKTSKKSYKHENFGKIKKKCYSALLDICFHMNSSKIKYVSLEKNFEKSLEFNLVLVSRLFWSVL